MSARAKRIVVVGSVNLDMVARVARLPKAGETITNGELGRSPGGKGANQALAARRLGADVSLLACVGNDAMADEALALLRAANVDLSGVIVDSSCATGVALIAVDARGENQIVVAPGANRRLFADKLQLPRADALICQLEVPVETLAFIAHSFEGFLCVNLAPVTAVPEAVLQRADLMVVNEGEAKHYGDLLRRLSGLVATTLGSRGAVLYRQGEVVATTTAPAVTPVDTTGAGDCFTAALTLGLAEGQEAGEALRFACAAAAVSTTGQGAQAALPSRAAALALLAG
ncbi:MAG: ribokinase [Woeseia sp.]